MRFEATDGLDLSGLLFEPRRRTGRAIVFLHGTGGSSIFDSRRTNLLANEFTSRGFAWFPFNNRGAHLVIRKKSLMAGMAHERIRDCVFDIDGAARELRRRGYGELFLVGHSTGANKVAVYDHHKPRNPFRRYVLLAGGDDTGLLYQQLGPRRFRAALAKARQRIHQKRGDEFVPPSLSSLPMTWRAFLDMANPDGHYNVFPFLEAISRTRLSRRPLFRYVKSIRKPALLLYGDRDEYTYPDVSTAAAALADAIGPKPNLEIAVMSDADHGFGGKEGELGRTIAEWLDA